MNNKMMWGIVVAAFIVGGITGFIVEQGRATTKLENYKLEVQKQTAEAKAMEEKKVTRRSFARIIHSESN